MSAEILFECIGNINDTYIKEAEEAISSQRTVPFRMWRPALAAAACIVVVTATVVGLQFGQGLSSNEMDGLSANDSTLQSGSVANDTTSQSAAGAPEASLINGLPKLSAKLEVSGMGFEGLFSTDSSTLIHNNPWTTTTVLSTLPVYQNTMEYYPSGVPKEADLEAMAATGTSIAIKLGADESSLTVTDNAATEEQAAIIYEKLLSAGMDSSTELFQEQYNSNIAASYVQVSGDGITVKVDADQTAYIQLQTPIDLGKERSHFYYSPLSMVQSVGSYLLNQPVVTSLLERPILDINGGSYDFYANQSYHIDYYSDGDTLEERLVNYNFNRLSIYPSEDGTITSLRLWHTDLSNKLGDYPVITLEKAQELLLAGNYLTTVPEAMPGEEYIWQVELVYRNSSREEVWMPYYRFYVELPGYELDNGLNDYGAYYVPAVSEEYLTALPVWDESFN